MSTPKPRLLVSVRDATEALEALAGGADWIDLKEPLRGPLGAVDPSAAQSVVEVVAGRVPISAAAGELVHWPDAGAELASVEGISLLKVGLAHCRRQNAWRQLWQTTHRQIALAGKSLAAVIYADAPSARAPLALEVIETAAEYGCPWVLWDTFDKSAGPLPSHVSDSDLRRQFSAAKSHGMRTVVAGRLTAASLPLLPWGSIDMIAVRGAACQGSRNGVVCRRRVAELREAIAAERANGAMLALPTRSGHCSEAT